MEMPKLPPMPDATPLARDWLRRREAERAAGKAHTDLHGDFVKPTRLGALAKALPGFASLWQHRVPAGEVDGGSFVCRCGAPVTLQVGEVVHHEDRECRRSFLRTEVDVRVHRWPAEPEDDGVEVGER